jgi:hypothetical protein
MRRQEEEANVVKEQNVSSSDSTYICITNYFYTQEVYKAYSVMLFWSKRSAVQTNNAVHYETSLLKIKSP